MASLNQIRSTFLKYFADNDHEVVRSSALVPRNDPTLMFTNSGMVQFKNVFTGLEGRENRRAVTSQKCVRAGGKHNDLDNVGYTARHHTFFEMLGNFSFGDYFKEQAIYYCWNLITKEYGVDPSRLLATVYHEDEEAAALWKSIAGFSDQRIIRISTSDNFWSMGSVGPCGPCSELFFDYGDDVPGGPPGSEDEDGDRFTEIWNLVFMQFEQCDDGRRINLPRPSIDTGMGLERIAALLQGVHDNYATDLFLALIESVAELTSTDPSGAQAVHHRVIVDHLRSSAFLLAEGIMPSKVGRGYVLRRIMRRAMRHAYLLGSRQPLMHRLVPELVRHMGAAFPELNQAQETIEYILCDEEERFQKTLGRGLNLLDDELKNMPEDGELSGDTAFKLYDTYGFPLDLTQDAMREAGRAVDVQAFERAMDEQRRRARAAMGGIGEAAEDTMWIELAEKFGTTEFHGYETEKAEGQILALTKDGQLITQAEKGETVNVIVNQTPFYAESGGQVGDTGLIVADGGRAEIKDTTLRAGLYVHQATVQEGRLMTDTAVQLRVDGDRRARIRANHSATHLLHETLRRILGKHVAQRGSSNDADHLRFDFSHNAAVDRQTMAKIEREVNHHIWQNSKVVTRVMTPEDAIKEGAMALFGEKYTHRVRVVSMAEDEESGAAFSKELCGGTHVHFTGDIGLFVTTHEGAVAAGIRRIEALTGDKAYHYLHEQDQLVCELSLALNVPRSDLVARAKSLMDERKSLSSQVTHLRQQTVLRQQENRDLPISEINGLQFIGQELQGVPAKDLRLLIDRYKQEIKSGIVALISDVNGKAAVAVGVTEDLTANISAIELVRVMTPIVGGSGGGGRSDFAQGGGRSAQDGGAALKAVKQQIMES